MALRHEITGDGGGSGGAVLRAVLTVLMAALVVSALILNGLAGPGLPPFHNSTGDISDLLYTCITPAGYTFIIWGFIYAAIAVVTVYAVALLFVRVEGVRAWRLGGAVSQPFMAALSLSMAINMGWLFAWDSTNVIASAVLLLLIFIVNFLAVAAASYSFYKVGPELQRQSTFHFWCGILTINGVGLYLGWTTIAALLNLTIFFQYQVEVDGNGTCIGMLVFLMVAFLVWFVVENVWLKVLANPLVTHYVVLVWATAGVLVEQRDQASTAVVGLLIALQVVASVLLLARVALLVVRNINNGIYGGPSSASSRVGLDTSSDDHRHY